MGGAIAPLPTLSLRYEGWRCAHGPLGGAWQARVAPGRAPLALVGPRCGSFVNACPSGDGSQQSQGTSAVTPLRGSSTSPGWPASRGPARPLQVAADPLGLLLLPRCRIRPVQQAPRLPSQWCQTGRLRGPGRCAAGRGDGVDVNPFRRVARRLLGWSAPTGSGEPRPLRRREAAARGSAAGASGKRAQPTPMPSGRRRAPGAAAG